MQYKIPPSGQFHTRTLLFDGRLWRESLTLYDNVICQDSSKI